MSDRIPPFIPRTFTRLTQRLMNVPRDVMAKYSCRRLRKMRSNEPIVSFSFDDFPITAWTNGGAILHKYGYKATYFVSFGLMGSNHPEIGLSHDLDVLRAVVASGHELGCHTFNHLDAWSCTRNAFEESITANQSRLGSYFDDLRFRTFAYPKGRVTPIVKRAAGEHFACCRGTYPGLNMGTLDLNMLKACSIYQRNGSLDRVKRLVKANVESRGWLIFYTHDIRDQCSPFGCTEDLFEKVVAIVAQSGARVLPIRDALSLAIA
jgi:peptidoglycan/xylan/chitin deacetylase (PgdA/CDA1 family)